MFGETTISYVKIGNHPIETTIGCKGFQVYIKPSDPEILKSITQNLLQPQKTLQDYILKFHEKKNTSITNLLKNKRGSNIAFDESSSKCLTQTFG